MFFCNMNRIDLLGLLPKGGEMAEVGVADGTFSSYIIDIVRPRRLHLIDLWEHQQSEEYAQDPNNVSGAEQMFRYQNILTKFAPEIASGRVCVHRSDSVKAATLFADGQLDWVFIDALHTKEGCAADLRAYQPKVKPDGLILGHDYTNHSAAQQMGFGVVEAVDEFVIEHGYHFLALTAENYPTYMLARNPASPLVNSLLGHLALNVKNIVEIPDFPQQRKYIAKVGVIGNEHRVIHSF